MNTISFGEGVVTYDETTGVRESVHNVSGETVEYAVGAFKTNELMYILGELVPINHHNLRAALERTNAGQYFVVVRSKEFAPKEDVIGTNLTLAGLAEYMPTDIERIGYTDDDLYVRSIHIVIDSPNHKAPDIELGLFDTLYKCTLDITGEDEEKAHASVVARKNELVDLNEQTRKRVLGLE